MEQVNADALIEKVEDAIRNAGAPKPKEVFNTPRRAKTFNMKAVKRIYAAIREERGPLKPWARENKAIIEMAARNAKLDLTATVKSLIN